MRNPKLATALLRRQAEDCIARAFRARSDERTQKLLGNAAVCLDAVSAIAEFVGQRTRDEPQR